ncbi:MAG: sigma-70 family RNA polymerase sigma factor [Candidatus Aminicenantes bacterium]|nr:sigma-70 family RNA polymerase sigma factor [Candidatus Aminicenantes bacterium]
MKKTLNISDQHARLRDIINRNIKFINRQCLNTVKIKSGSFLKSSFDVENEADRLFNMVLDKLSENDFGILRRFEGRSKITTYLTTIIARTAIDMIRARAGRERASEKTPEMDGPDGKPVVIKKGKIPDAEGTPVKEGIYSGERGEYIVPDNADVPEIKVLKSDSENKMNMVISEMLSILSGEERLLLRMKFPDEPERKPLSTDEIAIMLGISHKGVYNRIERLLKKCRIILTDAGVSLEDFVFGEFTGNVRHMIRREQ